MRSITFSLRLSAHSVARPTLLICYVLAAGYPGLVCVVVLASFYAFNCFVVMVLLFVAARHQIQNERAQILSPARLRKELLCLSQTHMEKTTAAAEPSEPSQQRGSGCGGWQVQCTLFIGEGSKALFPWTPAAILLKKTNKPPLRPQPGFGAAGKRPWPRRGSGQVSRRRGCPLT